MEDILDKYQKFLESIVVMYSPTSNCYQPAEKDILGPTIDFYNFTKKYTDEARQKLNFYLTEELNNTDESELKKELNKIAKDIYDKVKSNFFNQ